MPTPKQINCLAMDDEPPALQMIVKYIGAVPVLKLVGSCNNALDALSFLQGHAVDLLFLDIQMPHILGTDFMRTLVNPPRVIFTTAFRKFAVEGFELSAVDFLLKPISFERFLKAVNKVMQLSIPVVESFAPPPLIGQDTSKPFICIRADRKNLMLHLDDILFIESLKDYVRVVTVDNVVVSKNSISTMEVDLPGNIFVRTHRSFIVSLSKIQSFTQELIHIGKYEIPIGRSYRREVEKALEKENRLNKPNR